MVQARPTGEYVWQDKPKEEAVRGGESASKLSMSRSQFWGLKNEAKSRGNLTVTLLFLLHVHNKFLCLPSSGNQNEHDRMRAQRQY